VELDDKGFQVNVDTNVGWSGFFGSEERLDKSNISEICNGNAKLEDTVSLRHEADVVNLSFSPDGTRLLVATEKQTVVMWDLQSMSKVWQEKLNSSARVVCFSPSGHYFAACGVDSFLTLWNARSCQEEKTTVVEGGVLSMAMQSDPELLAIGLSSRKALLLSVPDLQEIAELQHGGNVRSLSFWPSADVLAGGGGIDDAPGSTTHKSRGSEMKTVLWKVSVNKCSCKHLGSVLFPAIVHAVAFSPSGKFLAAGGEDRTLTILLAEKGCQKINEFSCAANVRCLAWSPNSQYLASGGEDMHITVWDLVTQCVAVQLPRCKHWHRNLAFSSSYSWLAASCCANSEVTLHRMARGSDWNTRKPNKAPNDGGSAPRHTLLGGHTERAWMLHATESH